MHNTYHSIENNVLHLNNKAYPNHELANLINSLNISVVKEEKELGSFLQEWFNDDLFITVFTSGSTGKSKKIQLSKKSMVSSAKNTLQYFQLKKGDTIGLALSCNYIAGKMMVVRSIVGHLNLQLLPVNTKPLKHASQNFNFIALVSNQVESFLKYDKKYQPCSKVLVGGGTVSNYLVSQMVGASSRFYQSYAMTETASHVAIRPISDKNKEDVYTAVPGITFAVNDKNCLVINSNYLDQPVYETNDVVKLLSPTQFLFIGRLDNIINSGGVKMNPETIERKLEGHIPSRFYIGRKPDSVLGEKVVLIVEQSITEIDTEKIKKNISEVLEKYEIPKEIIILDKFEETPTGKILRSF